MSILQITLFGPPQVATDGAPVDISSDKPLALLIYLAVTQTPQRRDRLAALLWPDLNQSHARAYLRQALYLLTTHLGHDWFEADRRQIALCPGGDLRLDVREFEQHIKAARRGNAAVSHLIQAAALAQDEFLAGFSLPDAPEFDEWQLLQRENLRRQLGETLQTLVAHYQPQHDYTHALEYARRWVALDNLNEPAHCVLMQLLARSGQKAAALHHYAELLHLLRTELDTTPSAETEAIYTAIRQDQWAQTPLPRVADASDRLHPVDTQAPEADSNAGPQESIPQNLPRQLTPFVGREQELADLDRLLANEEVRLISVVGPGGMGKTRLGLACAERHLQNRRFAHGIYFVGLTALDHADRIAPTIAAALGYVPESGGPHSRSVAQQVVDYLHPKKMLLLLDNMEHLLDGSALLSDILRAAPGVCLLVTSRERLRMRAEHVLSIQGLDYRDPAAQAATRTAAVRLFEQSARRHKPDFTLDADNLAHVAQICRLVEGMPLGIELAAAWVDLLSPHEIAAEIRQSLTFLHSELRDIPDRHQSINAVFDATWQRLRVTEQAVFAALSVFRAGFTREAAHEIAGATLGHLSSLTDKSLIKADQVDAERQSRYRVHELLRQYGALKLAESPAVIRLARARHCAYFATFLETRLAAINGLNQRKAADEIVIELDNVRAAWQWAVDNANVEAIRQAATTLFLFCQLRSLFLEGAEMMAAAAAALQTSDASALRAATLAQVLNHEGWLRIRVGDFDRAVAALEASRRLYAQPEAAAPAPYMGTDPSPPLAIVAQIRGEYSRARELGEEALRAAVARCDQYNQSYAHYALTSLCAAQGDYVAAGYHAQLACETKIWQQSCPCCKTRCCSSSMTTNTCYTVGGLMPNAAEG